MRHIKIAGALLAIGFLSACGEPPTGTIKAPPGGPRYAIGTCSPAQNIRLDNVWKGTALTEATALWAPVQAACDANNTDALETALMNYLLWSLQKFEAADTADFANPSGNLAALYNQMTRHWRQTLVFAGYAGFDGVEGSFDLNGGVIRFINNPTGDVDITITGQAGLQLPLQDENGAHGPMIFIIRPVSGDCGGTNQILDEDTDICYEFSVFPTKTFSPSVKVGVCYPYNDGFARPALAHIHNGTTTILTPQVYPSAAVCESQEHPPVASIFGKATRLASRVFGVRTAYAGHGGLGGLTPTLSYFQPVDLRLFTANFDNSTVGSLITKLTPPEKGAWDSAFATAPGTIKVGAPLVDTLPSKHAVLNQGGGNCGNSCGGLDLWGRLETADNANLVDGKRYLVRWTSMQRQPSPKSAPIVITSSTGAPIATVSYSRVSGNNHISYNGTNVTTWVRNRPQTFELLVDMRTGSRGTKLWVFNDPYVANVKTYLGSRTIATSVTDLASIRAKFSGQDSGIMAWDDITITQLPDDAPEAP